MLTSGTPARKHLSTENRAKHLEQAVNSEPSKTNTTKGKSGITSKTGNPPNKTVLAASSTASQDLRSKPENNNKYAFNSNQKNDYETSADQNEHIGFTAVKRKNIVSYHISNIDSGVVSNDIYNYMYEQKVKCTNIRVYYGKIGATARINIHESDMETVEDPMFWPEDIICRKWQTKSDWDAELEKRYRERQLRKQNRQYRYQPRDNQENVDDDYYYNESDGYDKNEEADRERIEKWWHSWGKTDNDTQANRDVRDRHTYRR